MRSVVRGVDEQQCNKRLGAQCTMLLHHVDAKCPWYAHADERLTCDLPTTALYMWAFVTHKHRFLWQLNFSLTYTCSKIRGTLARKVRWPRKG